jgi:basic amino acid/polyamine antiporter, APA family
MNNQDNGRGRIQYTLRMTSGDLPRELSLVDAISIVAGIIIGAGIFLVPNLVAQSLPSASWIIAVWIVSGILSFCGALAFAEMGSFMPATGGQYVFLREAFGPLVAFLCGWTFFVVSMTASMAWLAVSFCRYLGYFVSLPPWGMNLVACVLVVALTWINYRGVTLAAWVQKIFTAAKLLGILVLVLSAVFFHPHVRQAAATRPIRLSDFGVAMISCLLAYDGWVNVSFVAGEIRDPRRNVFRALFIGVSIVMVAYIASNLAYLSVMTPAEIASSERVGADVAERTMGQAGGTFLSSVILLSIIGSLNGRFMTQARVYFAQARDGLFFERFAEVHPVYKTPSFALWMQAAWSVVLILTGSWNALINYALFAIWISYALSVAGVIVLRRKMPNVERPYKMWGYPVTPILFVIAASAFVINTAIEKPGPSLTALGLIALGWPVYWIWRKS